MIAQDVVARIQKRLREQGITWREQTVDTFKAGDPATEVKGIATTGMATFGLLRRAAKAGRNFVITHEPTFYNHQDQTATLERDATYQAKQRFIRENQMIVWRFHDHAHMLRPDPLWPAPRACSGGAALRHHRNRGFTSCRRPRCERSQRISPGG
jgi:hypothetical protein